MTYIECIGNLLIPMILVLLMRKIHFYTRRVLVFFWKLIVLRAILPIKVPTIFSIYNWSKLNQTIQDYTIPVISFQDGRIVSEFSSDIVNSSSFFPLLLKSGYAVAIILCVIVLSRSILLIRSSRKLSDHTLSDALTLFHSKQKIKIHTSEKIKSPISCNVFKVAYIIYPDSVEFGESDLTMLEHEVMHIKHFDSLWKLLSLIMVGLHWFNPLAWLIYYFFIKDIELACDEAVLNRHTSDYRSVYANVLIDCIPVTSSNSIASSASSFKANYQIKERVVSIMKHKKITKVRIMVSMFSIILASIIFLTNPVRASYVAEYASMDIGNTSEHSEPSSDISNISMDDGTSGKHSIPSNNYVVYDNDDGFWSLNEGDKINLLLKMTDKGFETGQHTEIGYILNDSWYPITQKQLFNGIEINFTATQTGSYKFYIKGASSDPIDIETFNSKRPRQLHLGTGEIT